MEVNIELPRKLHSWVLILQLLRGECFHGSSISESCATAMGVSHFFHGSWKTRFTLHFRHNMENMEKLLWKSVVGFHASRVFSPTFTEVRRTHLASAVVESPPTLQPLLLGI